MFTFEDLGGLDPTSIQTIIRAADKEKLANCSERCDGYTERFVLLKHVRTCGKIMKEDMGAMGPVRFKDVEESQQYIVSVAKDLESRGEIILSKGGNIDEDAMIY
jgi:flagellar motor switch protein FliG